MAVEGGTVALILAAGEGTRMKSKLAKVLHRVCGRPMIRHVVEAVRGLGPERIILVVGHQAEAVMEELAGEGLEFVQQGERLGTGHAVGMAQPLLDGFDGTLIVLTGDTPLLRTETLLRFLEHHRSRSSHATVLTAVLEDPTGYGRIIRDPEGRFLRIVEHKDASGAERRVKEINSGIFCFDCAVLFPALARVDRRNVQGEYYLTDVMEILAGEGKRVDAYRIDDTAEVLGINDCEQLEAAERLMRRHG